MDSGENDSGNYDEPLWKHVNILEETCSLEGESVKFLCDYCNRTFLGSYSTVEEHLLRVCEGMTPTIRAQVRSEFYESKNENARTRSAYVPVPHSAAGSYYGGMPDAGKAMVQSKKRKRSTTDLDEDYLMEIRDHLDAIIARMFYSSGLPFNVARNPYYLSSYALATRKDDIPYCTDVEKDRNHLSSQIARMFYSSGLPFNVARNPYMRSSFSIASMVHIPGYVPPGPKQLKTSLLQQEKTHIEGMLETIKSTWGKAGVTIFADGWSDVERRPVINILAVTESGPVFLEAINNEDGVKTKEYITDKLISAIENVEPENVVQVITDNDPVCRAAGALIQEKYSHIQWTPSIAHTLSLALKNICAAKSSEDVNLTDCHWISKVVDDATSVKNFIINHTLKLSIFEEFSKLKILVTADTRFASDIVMLKRLRLIKQSLLRMVISDQWPAYRKGNIEQAHIVKTKIIDDFWWDQIEYILAFSEPIYSMLRMVDTEKSCFHLICEMWTDMIEKVKAAIYKHEGKAPQEESAFYSAVHDILEDWWSKSKTPLHCLAHILNPRYYSVNWIDEAANRVPPHHDAEMSDTRNSCLRRLFPATDDLRTIKQQYAEFALLGTKYFSLASMVDRDELDPKTWWVTHGASASKLQSLALKLLSQPASSSCYEKNWSTYNYIAEIMKSKQRSKCAEDLVSVHTNLRLLSRTSEYYLTDPESRLWDVGGDDYLGCVLQSANFSLDEPEFELVMLEDDYHGGGENQMAMEKVTI